MEPTIKKQPAAPQTPKISVTPDAEDHLVSAWEKVNQGFLGGRISKMDLASWAISSALGDMTPEKIETIQKPFFNQLTYLESMVKLTRKNGQDSLTPEQLATLQSLFSQKPEREKTKSAGAKKIESAELQNKKEGG